MNYKYEFFIHSIAENTTRSIIAEYEPVKVSKKDKEEYLKRIERMWTNPRRNFTKREIKKVITFPKEKPPFHRIIVDDTGYIIFVTYKEDKKKGTECDLWDFEGNFIKKVYFKELPQILKFKNGKIYAIVETEDGWQRVVRFTINQ